MRRRIAGVALLLACFFASGGARSAGAPSEVGRVQRVNRVVVRFYSPETGGATKPRFITERVLSFEARLEMTIEGVTEPAPLDRHVRSALDHHVAEEMLARLPFDRGPVADELTETVALLRQALVERIGGDKGAKALLDVAVAEGLTAREVDAILARQARAAMYIDRKIAPLLKPQDEQLREVYRTAAHPYRRSSFEDARQRLARWFVLERLRVAVGAFYQGARSRVKLTIVARDESP